MNSRERFLETIRFGKPDRPPLCEFLGYWDETIHRWYGEGLPYRVDLEEYFGFDKGLTPTPSRQVPSLSFSISGTADGREVIPIDFGPIPRFGPRILRENKKYKVIIDEMGVKKMILKGKTHMPLFLEHPVKSKKDFEEIKKRFNPKDPRRYPLNWSKELIDYYNERDYPLGVQFTGFFGIARNLLGLKELLTGFFRNQDLIHEIMEFWAEFVIETVEEAVTQVKVDYASIWEDMAYKNGPHISPKLFKEFILPRYKKVIEMLKRNGVEIIMVDCDGNLEKLIPLLIEAGVNCLWPLEVQAGMDALKLRRKYGKKLALIGNIDKKALIKGRKSIREEVLKKVPELIKEGGYIPSIDHEVPVDVSLRDYRYYVELVKEVFNQYMA